ncbi:hypothetical protein KY362_07700 [Candidatus Woesearchaeota archaeon]|nr:hypothetical protein [Candidatus Woesearchaeota archaeon]
MGVTLRYLKSCGYSLVGMLFILALSMVLALGLSGCSSAVSAPAKDSASGSPVDGDLDSELRLEDDVPEEPAPEAPSTADDSAPEVMRSDWDLVREFVTSHSFVSEEYFDRHFVFDRVESGVELRSDVFDPVAREFPVLTHDADLVKYHLKLQDDAGNEYLIREYLEGVYIFEGQVVSRVEKHPAVDTSKIPRRVYEEIAPTHEFRVLVNKQDAIEQGKYIVDCTRKEWFDTWEARENLDLQFRNGKLVWAWESKGNACFINAEKPGEVEVLII